MLFRSAKDIVLDSMFSVEDRSKITTIMHSIWSARNRWVHDQDCFEPGQVLQKVREDLSLLELPRVSSINTVGQCWRPPDPGWIKINTDGALDPGTRNGGGGGVARSHNSFLGAWCKPFDGVTDPLIIEALALREGVIFAQLRGFSHVILEVDCLEVCDLWNSRHGSRSIVAPILDDVGTISASFNSFSIIHVKREANKSADLCAKLACNLPGSDIWLPQFLVNSLLADCNSMSFIQ